MFTSKTMANAIRDAFCEIYQKDVLMDFANDMRSMLSEKNLKKFPDMPTRGNLDLEQVKKSTFFCI